MNRIECRVLVLFRKVFDWIKPFPGEGGDWKLDVKWFGSGVQLFGIVVIDTLHVLEKGYNCGQVLKALCGLRVPLYLKLKK